MKGHYSKKLQNHSTLYTELQENQKLYYEHSFEKENKQKSFLKYNQFINSATGEKLNLDYDFEKKYKEYSKITEPMGKSNFSLILKIIFPFFN